MIPSLKKIGIIGGGQLGKMTCEASLPMGLHIEILDSEGCPASIAATNSVIGSISSAEDIYTFGKSLDVISYEIESIAIEGLIRLQKEGKTIIPSVEALQTIRDKGLQKKYYTKNNTPTIRFCVPESRLDFESFINECVEEKIVLKHRTGGYDGKGVEILNKVDALLRADEFNNYLLEQFLEKIIEYSVIVAVGNDGIKTYPLVEMYFNESSNLVEFLFSPAQIDSKTEMDCRDIAMHAVMGLNSKGLFAVELIKHNNSIYVNEIAPRPHNSGHHTMEGCTTSQFEQFVRVLFDLPLGDTSLLMPCAMVNLVGGANDIGNYQLEHGKELLQMSGVYIHLYNKKDIKPNRKMGHINIIASNFEELIEKAKRVQALKTFNCF